MPRFPTGWLLGIVMGAMPLGIAGQATPPEPLSTLTPRTTMASPLAMLGLSPRLGFPIDSLHRVGRGVWIYDVQIGNGDSAAVNRRVDLHHVGMFRDGTIFTRTSRTPFSFVVGDSSVIQGWQDGVLGMRVGGRRLLVIPSELGYGKTGEGKVPPDAVLVFDLTLVDVH